MLRKYEKIWIQFESIIPEWIDEGERLPVYTLIFIHDNTDEDAEYSLNLKEFHPDMQPITTSNEMTAAKAKLIRKMRCSCSDLFILNCKSLYYEVRIEQELKYQGLCKCLKNVNKSYKKWTIKKN